MSSSETGVVALWPSTVVAADAPSVSIMPVTVAL